jgi:tape measure domain-containing protein
MASDGKVVIDVILEDGTVAKGVANIDKKLGGVTNAGKRAAAGIKEMVTALGLVALASKAIDAVKNSLDGAIARYDTLKSFPVVMEQIGFSAEQAQNSINKLSDGIDGLPTTLDSIVANTKRIALLTGDLELATDTALALNNAFLASGSSAADAERGLTQYVQMLSKGKVDAQSWYTLQETMGYALTRTAEAFGFAGESAQNNLLEALQSGTITFSEFNAKLIELSNTTGGFADIAKNSTSGIATSFSNMRNAVVKGVANVIDAIDQALGGTGTIASHLDKVKVGINQVFDWIVSEIPLVAAAIRSVKEALDPWIPSFTEVSNIIQNLLGGAIAFVQQAFANLVNVWQQNGQSILSSAITFFTGVWNTVQTAFTGIYNVISDVLGSRVLPFVQEQLANLQQFWQENGQQIMQAVENAFKFIQSVIEFVMPAIKFVIEIVWSAIQDIISGALSIIQGLIQVFTGIFTGDFSQLWEGIKSIFKGAIDLIVGWMSLSFLGGIRRILTNLLKNGVTIVKNMWTSIVNFFKTFADDAASKVSGMASKVWEFAKNMANNFINTISNLKNNVVNKFSEIKNEIIDKVKSIDLKDIGKNIIQGLINGIGSMASAVVDKVKSIGKSISNGFKNALGIHSPSKVMADIAKWIPAGIGVGIEKNEKSALKSMKGLAESLTDQAQVGIGVTNRLRGANLSLGNLIPATITAGANAMNPALNNGFSSQRFNNLISAIKDLASRPVSVQIDGREIVFATVDDMSQEIEFREQRNNRFKG